MRRGKKVEEAEDEERREVEVEDGYEGSARHYSKYITNVPCGATRVPAHLLSQ